MLVPLADLINHYAVEQCTTEIVHRDLEQMDDDKKRQDLGYRKARGNYDISLLVPDAKFVAGNKKSFAVHFIEAFEKKVVLTDSSSQTSDSCLCKKSIAWLWLLPKEF
jgi:hypothetical protein